MTSAFAESDVEEAALAWLAAAAWRIARGPDIAPDAPAVERCDYSKVALAQRLRDALARLNPALPTEVLEDAFRKLTRREGTDLIVRNRALHRLLVDGVTVEYRDAEGNMRGVQPWVIDFDDPGGNDWNPLIASVFYRRGIIETWGQGALRMAAWAAEAGLPKPEILEVPGAVVVRFRAKATKGKAPQKAPQKAPDAILGLLRQQPERSFSEIAALLGKSESAVKRAVRKLRETGRLLRIGPDKGGHWQVIE